MNLYKLLFLIIFFSISLKAEKPNIVFIMADDQGYGDASCYNPESKFKTPGIDRIAREGIKFTDAHSASAVCTPTRYGLLTGRYPWRSRTSKRSYGDWPGKPDYKRINYCSVSKKQWL